MDRRQFLQYLAPVCGAVFAAAQSEARAREVEHRLGTTRVPDTPMRIVALEFSFVDALASVGVAPVGIADDNRRDRIIPAYTDVIGDAWISVGTRKTPSLEQIAALAPDLIIADHSRHAGAYPILSQIAPTLVYDSLRGDYSDALVQMQDIAHAIGRAPQMAARLAEHAALMQRFKDRLPDPDHGLTGYFGVVTADGLFLHRPNSYAGSLLAQFGFRSDLDDAGGARAQTYVPTSLERLSALDPDLLIVGAYAMPHQLDAWRGEAVFEALKVAQNNAIYPVDAHQWARLRGLLAAERSARDILNILDQHG